MSGEFWLLIAGWRLALGHLIFAAVNFALMIGIPAGRRHLMLACVSLNPIGQIIVADKDATKAKKNDARQIMQKLKNELSD